ncbi:DUF4157 domain-containing protein [Streptomyces sp. WAC 01529]|uniref:eCIS core domain-containing protein n=1 Tax=Streptomyces sp. WAC 01529 TaxID=2203205 RepID=UPI001F0C7B00|nr:DUF4157 domain-containing protein [Streptomyces sp. WAC 01529]
MQQREHSRTATADKGRGPARRGEGAVPGAGILGLQRGAGNAAVVQMLRQSGHPWAGEPHQHGAGCGHSGEEPQVQRSAVHDVLRGAGKPLDDATRGDMESRLGADFSDVRVHDDAAARASAAEVGARAYTSGSHVVIGDGGADRHTLAHELTHVIQQRQGPVAGTDNGDGLKVSDPGDRFEREAEANARRVMAADPGPAPAERAAAPRTAGASIQRYASGTVKSLASEQSDEPFFESQSPQGVLVPDAGRLSKHSVDHVGARAHDPFQQDVSEEEGVQLDAPLGLPVRVAGDGTLAVHDTEREPKEFYATREVLAASNTSLQDVNSTYRLEARGQKITVQNPESPNNSVVLERVQPVTVETPQNAASGFANLMKHECIDVARELMGGGKQTEVVLEGREPMPWQDSTVDSVAHDLADQVGADQGPTPQRYGGALREHPAEMDEAARERGVNKAAAPVVGEGYTTVSLGQSDKLDYADSATPEARPQDIWGFHFAGVAAMSADGQDRVTLENYTRTANSGDALKELLPKLVEEFKKQTAIPLLRPGGKTPPTSAFEMDRLNKLLRELSGSAQKAGEEFKRLSDAKNEWNSKWFFRMYGSGAGQTFHEQQYNNGRGDFVNPLTLRVRKPRPQQPAS